MDVFREETTARTLDGEKMTVASLLSLRIDAMLKAEVNKGYLTQDQATRVWDKLIQKTF